MAYIKGDLVGAHKGARLPGPARPPNKRIPVGVIEKALTAARGKAGPPQRGPIRPAIARSLRNLPAISKNHRPFDIDRGKFAHPMHPMPGLVGGQAGPMPGPGEWSLAGDQPGIPTGNVPGYEYGGIGPAGITDFSNPDDGPMPHMPPQHPVDTGAHRPQFPQHPIDFGSFPQLQQLIEELRNRGPRPRWEGTMSDQFTPGQRFPRYF